MQLNKFVVEFGLSQKDVENWLSRPSITLRTHYAETKRGRAREFTRENVMELVIMDALVSMGCKPSHAPMWAEAVMDEHKRPISPPRYVAFPSGEFSTMEGFVSLDTVRLTEILSRSKSQGLALIDVGTIVDRVDHLFRNEAQMQEGENANI